MVPEVLVLCSVGSLGWIIGDHMSVHVWGSPFEFLDVLLGLARAVVVSVVLGIRFLPRIAIIGVFIRLIGVVVIGVCHD